MGCFLGIDMGTSSVKITAMDENSRMIGRCGRDYSYSQPHPGWKEIWPERWAEAVEDGLEELLAGLDREQVKAIGFTGQMHTTVFLDHKGACIRPAIMWNDMRTKELIPWMKEELKDKEDAVSILRILSTGSPAANLMWLREREWENFQKLRKFLIGPDYLVYHFSGAFSTDYCEASTSSLYDSEGKCWSESMKRLLGLPDTAYPPVLGSQEIVGGLSEKLQKKLGLPAGVRIIAGTGDNPAAAVASGCLQKHCPVLSIGTSGVLLLSREKMDRDIKGKQILFSLDGREIHVLVQGVVQSAGGSYNWYARNILGLHDFDRLTESVDIEKLGEADLLFYPHLTGDKTIYGDPELRGALIGLDTNHTKEDLAVAVMEGVCFAVKQLIREMGVSREELGQMKVTGGGSHSGLWMQILADVLNVTIQQLDGGEGASYGAAVMARNAVHPPKDPGSLGQSKGSRRAFTPRPYQAKLYEGKYRRYLKIHDALKMIDR